MRNKNTQILNFSLVKQRPDTNTRLTAVYKHGGGFTITLFCSKTLVKPTSV